MVLLYRHLHHDLLHRGAVAAGGEAGFVGVVGEDDEEVAVADDHVGAGAVGIAGGIFGFVIRDGLRHLREGLAADELGALNAELDVGELAMRLISLRVHERRLVCAYHGLDALLKLMRTDLNVGRHIRNKIERQIQGRRQAFVEADVFDVVVDHIRWGFLFWAVGEQIGVICTPMGVLRGVGEQFGASCTRTHRF